MPVEPAPGSTFAGYRIEALLARGGMGVVYRATELALERPVALKLRGSPTVFAVITPSPSLVR